MSEEEAKTEEESKPTEEESGDKKDSDEKKVNVNNHWDSVDVSPASYRSGSLELDSAVISKASNKSGSQKFNIQNAKSSSEK